ncbi:hypothetical protein NQ318_002669 [Aromia moschata]|uniref:Uncharacterized protein n=1 Tax=Aromia moschata TaxID=1265417 RepID=A0AAV8XTW7_9CUCU|nr:hypothetical protein NQ318_002669 [Aromia moschata]
MVVRPKKDERKKSKTLEQLGRPVHHNKENQRPGLPHPAFSKKQAEDLSDSEDIDEEPAKNNDIEIEEPENANDFEDNIEFESLIDEENEPQQKKA